MVDLVGVGNLNTDKIVYVDDSVLEKAGLRKGDDAGKTKFDLLEREILKDYGAQLLPGGAVANTLSGANDLGVICLLGGILGLDQLGEEYLKDVRKRELLHKIIRKPGTSACVYALITPDKERTFADDIGVANDYEKDDMPYDNIEPGCVFYTTHYALQGDGRPALLDLIKHAKAKKAKTGFDLGSCRVINRDREFLKNLLSEDIDMVFCNDDEAESLTGLKTDDAIDSLGEMCETAVITLGAEGVLIKHEKKYYRIHGYPAKPVDKTGAGDAFRAGFFYGLFKTGDLEKAGRIGCLYASKVVACLGARLNLQIENIENQV